MFGVSEVLEKNKALKKKNFGKTLERKKQIWRSREFFTPHNSHQAANVLQGSYYPDEDYNKPV